MNNPSNKNGAITITGQSAAGWVTGRSPAGWVTGRSPAAGWEWSFPYPDGSSSWPHHPSAAFVDPERACLGCQCCAALPDWQFYCFQCLWGARPK